MKAYMINVRVRTTDTNYAAAFADSLKEAILKAERKCAQDGMNMREAIEIEIGDPAEVDIGDTQLTPAERVYLEATREAYSGPDVAVHDDALVKTDGVDVWVQGWLRAPDTPLVGTVKDADPASAEAAAEAADNAKLIEVARDMHVVEGTLEIDDNAAISMGADGAYVGAWVFVDNCILKAIGVTNPDAEEDDPDDELLDGDSEGGHHD